MAACNQMQCPMQCTAPCQVPCPLQCPVQCPMPPPALPPMNNDLIPVNSFMALNHIKDIAPNVSSDFMLGLYNALLDRYSRGLPTVFSYIQAPNVKEITQQVIGSDGYYFKLTTIKSGIDFIWHDRDNNLFLFWGPSNFRVTKALNAISWRIRKITDQYNVDDTDYSDMPGLIDCDGELIY